MPPVVHKEFYGMEIYYFNVYVHTKKIIIWLEMLHLKSNGLRLRDMLNYEQIEIIQPLYII